MWRAQPKVPRLPIPTLEETLDRYLEAVRPLISEAQWEVTQKNVRHFQVGEGPKLQEELHRLDAESPTSWLEGFWDSMYLNLREPLLIHTAPFLLLREDPKRKAQVVRAACVVHACMRVLKQIRNNTLEPDFEREDPLDMKQYTRLFGSTRLPLYGRDYCVTYNDSKHIIVMSRNNFFSLDVLTDKGEPVSESDLQANFNYILENSQKEAAVPIGAFTTEWRNTWASLRPQLEEGNKKAFETIDRALFVLCLDDMAPQNLSEVSKALLHRDGTNRWWDKFMIVTFANGMTGNLLEHTPIDGHTGLRLWTEAAQYAKDTAPVGASSVRPSAQKIEWKFPSSLEKPLVTAISNVHSLITSTESAPIEFNLFGKKFLTNNKLSPDAFVQMAFQLAYYKLYGKTDSTYESANTKRFLGGRTETVRSVSTESVNFTKTWVAPGTSDKAKLDALNTALNAHTKRMNLCKVGRGVDRHLYGLLNLARHKQHRLPSLYYNFPPIFSDPAFSKLTTSVLSTSNVSSPHFELFGFGPVCPNGLGLAYNIHDDRLMINVTSFINEAGKYKNALENALIEMHSVVEAAKK